MDVLDVFDLTDDLLGAAGAATTFFDGVDAGAGLAGAGFFAATGFFGGATVFLTTFAGAFLATGFFATAFFATGFFTSGFFATAFFAAGLTTFFAAAAFDFAATGFFGAGFFATTGFAAFAALRGAGAFALPFALLFAMSSIVL
jgi:hypothetical protein